MSAAVINDTTVTELVGDAVAAPSMHNAQPWRFLYHRRDRTIDLYADPLRAMPTADPEGRALRIGCGAALLNLRVAAWHAGLCPEVSVSGERDASEPVATVRLREAAPHEIDHDLAGLYEMIGQRHTSRYPYAEEPLPDRLRQRLSGQAQAEGAMLSFPTGWHLALLLDVIEEAESDSAYTGDPDERKWVRTGTAESDTAPDGIPEYSLGARKREGRAPVRDFARGHAVTDRGAAAFERTPQLAVVSTQDDDPGEWLAAGQAMERVLLLATREGVASSFATQALERSHLRWLLRDPVRGAGPVQMILRLGYGPMGARTPRRAARDVLEITP
ncbi:nitroreductase family protein [Streptomyces oryzae]|uniref:Nitroreductase family protein n=1 Tax=Streptomyces oryzae TaxID=1434886 RepID=A0ABS3XG77_9ACTN|nr:nitroreductase family protein [Streptomyces oryzae]MBO8194304.1 nitroreductase family protein [Streptomyces oryzae]